MGEPLTLASRRASSQLPASMYRAAALSGLPAASNSPAALCKQPVQIVSQGQSALFSLLPAAGFHAQSSCLVWQAGSLPAALCIGLCNGEPWHFASWSSSQLQASRMEQLPFLRLACGLEQPCCTLQAACATPEPANRDTFSWHDHKKLALPFCIVLRLSS